MQQDIFGNLNPQPSGKKQLTIKKNKKQQLSKKQKEFNSLVKKLEKLRAEHVRLTNTLDESLNYYAEHLHPLEEKIIAHRITGVKIFYPIYKNKKLLVNEDRKILKGIIADALEEILSLSEKSMDDELKRIFKDVNGVSIEELKKDSFDEMKKEMEEMFSDMGVDVNLDDMHEEMTPEDIAKKLQEIQESVEQQKDDMKQKEASRKKTKHQAEREELERKKEEAKAKNINSIYKQLAKAFHPDLEKDETTRLQKEELMKQLTNAYESNDLHTLLKLEMIWLQKEENDIDKLSDEKLGIYNEVLMEQIAEAEMELNELLEHPRYTRLSHLDYDLWDINVPLLEKEKKDLKATFTALKKNEPNLLGIDSLKYVKEIIEEYRDDTEATDNWDDLMNEFFAIQRKGFKNR